MSQQAVLNMNKRNRDEEEEEPQSSSMRNNVRIGGIIFLFTVLCTIFFGGWIVLGWIEEYAQRLPFLRLIVTGERYYTGNDDIRQLILSLASPGKIINQDVNIIQGQIKRLPWIKQASVRKQWPNELKIHLVEYVPIARWNDQHLVDVNGNLFNAPTNLINQSLPLLCGPEGSKNEALQKYQEMEQMLGKNRFALKKAAMTVRNSWQLTLTNGIKLHLGRGDTMKRIARFVELYPVLFQQAQSHGKRIGYVDLRYNSGAAVGWIDVEETKQQ